MGFIRKWIQSLSVPVDEATGAIRVTGVEGGGGDGYEVVGLKDTGDVRIDPATKGSVDAVTAALSSPAQAGEADNRAARAAGTGRRRGGAGERGAVPQTQGGTGQWMRTRTQS